MNWVQPAVPSKKDRAVWNTEVNWEKSGAGVKIIDSGVILAQDFDSCDLLTPCCQAVI